MPNTDQVIIEFVADTSQLTPGVEQLEQLGQLDQGTAVIFQKTNEQLKQRSALFAQNIKDGQALTATVSGQQESYNKLVSSVKNLSGEAKNAVQAMLKFATGDIANAFKANAVTVDQYVSALEDVTPATNNATKSSVSLRTELRNVTQQLAQLTLAGEEGSQEFTDLALKAGTLKNAMKDTQQVVSGLGEDVPILTTMANAAQGLTATVGLATSAIGLFGDEGEALQPVLLKVNQLMLFQQSLSQLVALANDKATISTARLAVAKLTENAQTAISNGLTSKSIIVKGAATVAQYALNLAMSLNPVGLLVIGISALVAGLEIFATSSVKAKEATEAFNQALENNAKLQEQLRIDEQNTGVEVSLLQKRNAQEYEITIANQENIRDARLKIQNQIYHDQDLLRTLDDKRDKESKERKEKLQQQIADNTKKSDDLFRSLLVSDNALEKQLGDKALADAKAQTDEKLAAQIKGSDAFFAAQRIQLAAQQAIDLRNAGDNIDKQNQIKAEGAQKLRDINVAQLQADQARELAITNDALLRKQILSRRINSNIADDEVALQNKAIRQAADDAIEVGRKTGELTLKQQQEISDKATLQIEQNNREQAQRQLALTNANQNALIDAYLANVKVLDSERLALEEQEVLNESAVQIGAAKGNAQQILKIEAETNAKIIALRVAAIDKQYDEAQSRLKVQTQNEIDNIQKSLDAQAEIRAGSTLKGGPKAMASGLGIDQTTVQQQQAQIDQLDAIKQKAIALDIKRNQEKYDAQGLSDQQYQDNYEALLNESVAADNEAAEKKKRIAKDAADYQKQLTLDIISASLSGVAQGLQLLQSLYQQQDQAAQDALNTRKQNVADELAAGVITAKAAETRNKEIEAQQKKLKHDAAVRNKELAIFNAIIGTAQAVIAALDAPPPLSFISAAIAGALGAAQIAIVASQPIPAFARGKRGSYEGLGLVGEAGAEIVESNGHMFVAQKPTVMWVGARDKIYNAQETRAMMNTGIPTPNGQSLGAGIDYNKIGKAVADNIPAVELSIDGYRHFIKDKHSFETRLNERRKWR